MTDAEREQHIVDCGYLLEKAMAEGNADEAQHQMALMYAAIEARSPAQQARMTAEIERRIDEGVDYFQVQGARDGRQLGQGVSHA